MYYLFYLLSFYCLSSQHFYKLFSGIGFQPLWFYLSSLGTRYSFFTIDYFSSYFYTLRFACSRCLASRVFSFVRKPFDSLRCGPSWSMAGEESLYGGQRPYGLVMESIPARVVRDLPSASPAGKLANMWGVC